MSNALLVRREIRYTSFDEVLADAERLVRAGAATTGNWSVAQILGHLAIAMERSIDGVPGVFPWYVCLVGRYLVKPRILKHGMKPGFRLPNAAEKWAVPASDSDADATLAQLRSAIDRLRAEYPRSPHPVFGPLTAAEWDALHLRHAELHMSFIEEL